MCFLNDRNRCATSCRLAYSPAKHENNSRLRGRIMRQVNGRTIAPRLHHQSKSTHTLPLNTSPTILPAFCKAFTW